MLLRGPLMKGEVLVTAQTPQLDTAVLMEAASVASLVLFPIPDNSRNFLEL